MSISDRRSWWNRRRKPQTPASLLLDAGRAQLSTLEELESRVLLSDPGSTFADAQELLLDGDGVATYDDDLPDIIVIAAGSMPSSSTRSAPVSRGSGGTLSDLMR